EYRFAIEGLGFQIEDLAEIDLRRREPDDLAGAIDDHGAALAILGPRREKNEFVGGLAGVLPHFHYRWFEIGAGDEIMRGHFGVVDRAFGRWRRWQPRCGDGKRMCAVLVIRERDIGGDGNLLARGEGRIRDEADALAVLMRLHQPGVSAGGGGGDANR